MSLVEVQDLSVAFGNKRVVNGVSFTLERGETLALVGESGSGKSVTALSLLQLLPSGGNNPSGSILLNEEQMIGADADTLHRARGVLAGMVFQEPMNSLNPLHRIGRQVAEAMTLHRRMPAHSLRERVIDVLSQAGFADAEHRLEAFPHQLSGGQRQRVMIAMALANNPALLIADEPTTALDVTIQAQILKLLTRLRTERRMALLLITHDLQIVRRYADRVCVMKDGEVVEAGRVADVFEAPYHPYTCMLLAAVPQGRPAPLSNHAHCLLKAEDVKVHFPIRRGVLRRTVGYVRAVDGVSLAVREGETLGLVGEVRLGQDHHGARDAASGAGHGTDRVRRRRHSDAQAARNVRPAFQHADRVPGSVRQSLAAYAGRRGRCRRASRARTQPQSRRTRLSGRRGAGGGWTAGGYRCIATPTSSAAVSGSASPSHARWC